MQALAERVGRIGSVLMLLSAFACTSSPDDPEPSASHSGAEAAGHAASAAVGSHGAGRGGTSGAGKSAADGGKAGSQTSAGRGGSSAAGNGGPSAGQTAGHDAAQDAGADDVDAAVSCDGEIVGSRTGCLQDDAFCYPLGDGRYCTGPQAAQTPASGKQCGARAGDTCQADEYCAYQPGAYCGQADAQATCQKRPSSCSGPSAAVCGCDQQTYPSACEANKAGTGVYAAEACK